jgi:hypothetical protein
MRIVGHRKQYDISLEPSAAKLMKAARWNDTLSRPGAPGVFPRGVYCYRSHAEADEAWLAATVDRVVAVASSRNDA